MAITEQQVKDALQALVDPNTRKDYLSSKSARNIKVDGNDVSVDVQLGYPAKSQLVPVRDEITAKLKTLPGVGNVSVNVTMNIIKHAVQRGVKLVPGVKNIIAVASGKGGVGKSTTAVNVAVALARMGARVGLLDGDVYGPNIPQMLGSSASPEVDGEKRIVPPEAQGIKVISMGMLVPPDQPIIWRGPMLHGAVQQFMRDVAWGELDYLVVDLPPGTGDVALSMAQSVPMAGAVVVTTPQGVSVSDVKKAVGMFRQLNIPVLGVIENMSYFVCGHCHERTEIFGSGGGRKIAEEMQIPFLGEVPIDTRVRSGGDDGQPIVSAAPDAPAAQAFSAVASQVAAQVSIQNMRVLRVIQTA